MSFLACAGAVTQCSFGLAPSSLMVLPLNRVLTGPPVANTLDSKPLVNVAPFGACQSLANPTVVAATAAALGVLTPMPCVPVTPAPWVPGSPGVLVGEMPALDSTSKLMCAWGGVIQIVAPGQVQVSAP